MLTRLACNIITDLSVTAKPLGEMEIVELKTVWKLVKESKYASQDVRTLHHIASLFRTAGVPLLGQAWLVLNLLTMRAHDFNFGRQ